MDRNKKGQKQIKNSLAMQVRVRDRKRNTGRRNYIREKQILRVPTRRTSNDKPTEVRNKARQNKYPYMEKLVGNDKALLIQERHQL